MMAGGNAGKAIVAAAGAHATLPRGWRAAEALCALLPARLKGAMASAFALILASTPNPSLHPYPQPHP